MKAAYSKSTSKKLAETTAKLEGITSTIRQAIATGRLDASEQLSLAQQAAELNIVTVQTQLSRLRKSGEDDWEDIQKEVDDSWEHLSRSIRSLADRFSDGMR